MTTIATTGAGRLAEFLRAPEKTQQDFWRQLAAEVEREQESNLRLSNEWAQAGEVFRPIVGWVPSTQWTEKWRKRAAFQRRGEERGFADDSQFEAERQFIWSIPAEEFVRKLTGEEVPRHRKVPCPVHEERTASLHVYKWKVRCFGCGAGGDIYEFAGALFDIDPRSSRFRELHHLLYAALQ